MDYRITHRSTYKYKAPVSVSNHVACLAVRPLPRQRVLSTELDIVPAPATLSLRTDFFGNQLCFFTIQEPHTELVVSARSEVVVEDGPPPQCSLPWEDVAQRLPHDTRPQALDAYQFTFESPRIRQRHEFTEYALASFTPGRPMQQALLELTARIHADFEFESGATTVRTTPEDVFRKRRGVCQDFAQLEIACLRSIGLAARYVSGYLRTLPPPGKPRLIGADASHAWLSAYCPDCGWLDVDPTNNVVPSDGHVTLAWGRDYGDVSPLRGLVLGGGAHTLKVGVDMEPVQPGLFHQAGN